MKEKFIRAYMYEYGTTKKEALKVYRDCINSGNIGYITAIIDLYDDQCKLAFYND